jgi:hypothetical protein
MSDKVYTQEELEQWLDQKCGANETFSLVFKEALAKMNLLLDADSSATASVHIDPEVSLVSLAVTTNGISTVLLSWGPEAPTSP